MITQPLRGAEKEGAAGLLKGIGKGMAGLVLKPGAGMCTPFPFCEAELLPSKSGNYANDILI